MKIKNIIITAIIFIMLSISGYFLVNLFDSKQVIEKKANAINLITSEGFAIKSRIDRALSSTYGLGILIEKNYDILDNFQQIATTLKEVFNEIDVLIIAPNLIVADVYPPDMRRSRIGENLLSNAERKNDIILAIKDKKLSLGGPYSLQTGGSGLIGRLPVFINENGKNDVFWGIITVTINIEHLIDSTNLKSLETSGYYFELNKLEYGTKKVTSIIKTGHKKLYDPVTIKIDLQNTDDDWYLSISPRTGWINPVYTYMFYFIIFIFSLTISVFIFNLISQPETLKQKINLVTEELNSKNKILIQTEKLANFAKLTSAIAHEIRQPLNSIKILTDGAIYWNEEKHKLSYNEIMEYFSNISANVVKIDEIIKNLKLMITSPGKIETKPVNINNIIRDVSNIFTQKIANHRINIIHELDEKIGEINLSERQFQQIIINLLDNAIKVLDTVEKNDKMIKIKTEGKEDCIKISVIDNGPGISDEIKEKIFDPFFTTGIDRDSMGMGLYVVRNILKNFNSEIIAMNNPLQGTIFEINLKR